MAALEHAVFEQDDAISDVSIELDTMQEMHRASVEQEVRGQIVDELKNIAASGGGNGGGGGGGGLGGITAEDLEACAKKLMIDAESVANARSYLKQEVLRRETAESKVIEWAKKLAFFEAESVSAKADAAQQREHLEIEQARSGQLEKELADVRIVAQNAKDEAAAVTAIAAAAAAAAAAAGDTPTSAVHGEVAAAAASAVHAKELAALQLQLTDARDVAAQWQAQAAIGVQWQTAAQQYQEQTAQARANTAALQQQLDTIEAERAGGGAALTASVSNKETRGAHAESNSAEHVAMLKELEELRAAAGSQEQVLSDLAAQLEKTQAEFASNHNALVAAAAEQKQSAATISELVAQNEELEHAADANADAAKLAVEEEATRAAKTVQALRDQLQLLHDQRANTESELESARSEIGQLHANEETLRAAHREGFKAALEAATAQLQEECNAFEATSSKEAARSKTLVLELKRMEGELQAAVAAAVPAPSANVTSADGLTHGPVVAIVGEAAIALRAEHEKEIEQLRVQNEALDLKWKDMAAEVKDLNDVRETLIADNDALQANHDTIAAEVDQLRVQVTSDGEIVQQCQQLNYENAEMQKVLDSKTKSEEAHVQLLQKYADDAASAKGVITALQLDLDAAKVELGEMQAGLERSLDGQKRSEAARQANAATTQQLEENLRTLKESYDEIASMLEAGTAENDMDLADLKLKLSQSHADAAIANSRIVELQGQEEAAAALTEQAAAENENFKAEITAKLESTRAALNAAIKLEAETKTNMETVEIDLAHAQKATEDFERDAVGAASTIAALENELAGLQAEQRVLEAASQSQLSTISALKTSLDEQSAAASTEDPKIAFLEAQQAQHLERIAALEGIREKLVSQIAVMTTQISTAEAQVKELNHELESLGSKSDELQQLAEEREASIGDLQARLSAADAAANAADAAAAASAERAGVLATALDEHKAQLVALDAEVASNAEKRQTEAGQTNGQITAAESAVAALQHQLDADASEAAATIAGLQQQIASATETNLAWQKHGQQMQQQLSAAHESASSYAKQLQDEHVTASAMSEDLAALGEERDALRAQVDALAKDAAADAPMQSSSTVDATATLAAEEALAAERDASAVQIGDLNAKLERTRTEIEGAENRCAATVAAMAAERLKYGGEINELIRTLDHERKLRMQNESLSASVSANQGSDAGLSDSDIAKLQAELAAQNANTEAYSIALEAEQGRFTQVSLEVEGMAHELKKAKAEAADAMELLGACRTGMLQQQRQLDEYASRLSNTQGEATSAKEEAERLIAESADASANREDAALTIIKLKEELEKGEIQLAAEKQTVFMGMEALEGERGAHKATAAALAQVTSEYQAVKTAAVVASLPSTPMASPAPSSAAGNAEERPPTTSTVVGMGMGMAAEVPVAPASPDTVEVATSPRPATPTAPTIATSTSTNTTPTSKKPALGEQLDLQLLLDVLQQEREMHASAATKLVDAEQQVRQSTHTIAELGFQLQNAVSAAGVAEAALHARLEYAEQTVMAAQTTAGGHLAALNEERAHHAATADVLRTRCSERDAIQAQLTQFGDALALAKKEYSMAEAAKATSNLKIAELSNELQTRLRDADTQKTASDVKISELESALQISTAGSSAELAALLKGARAKQDKIDELTHILAETQSAADARAHHAETAAGAAAAAAAAAAATTAAGFQTHLAAAEAVLKEQMAAKDAEIASLRDTLHEVDAKAVKDGQRFAASKSALESLERQVAVISAAEVDRTTAEAEQTAAQAANDGRINELTKALHAWQTKYAESEGQLSASRAAIDGLRAELDATISSTSSSIEHWQETADSLKQELATTAQAAAAQGQAVKEEQTKHAATVKSIVSERQVAQQSINELNSALVQSQALATAENEKLQDRAAMLGAELADARADLEKANAANAELQVLMSSGTVAETMSPILAHRLTSSLQERAEAAEGELVAVRQAVIEHLHLLEEERSKHAEVAAQLDSERNAHATARQVYELRLQQQQQQERRSPVSTEETLHSSLQNQSQNDDDAAFEKLEAVCDEMSAEISKLKNEAIDVALSREELTLDVKASQNEVANLKELLAARGDTVLDLETKLDTLRLQISEDAGSGSGSGRTDVNVQEAAALSDAALLQVCKGQEEKIVELLHQHAENGKRAVEREKQLADLERKVSQRDRQQQQQKQQQHPFPASSSTSAQSVHILSKKLQEAEEKVSFVYQKFIFASTRCKTLEKTCRDLLDASANANEQTVASVHTFTGSMSVVPPPSPAAAVLHTSKPFLDTSATGDVFGRRPQPRFSAFAPPMPAAAITSAAPTSPRLLLTRATATTSTSIPTSTSTSTSPRLPLHSCGSSGSSSKQLQVTTSSNLNVLPRSLPPTESFLKLLRRQKELQVASRVASRKLEGGGAL